MLPSPETPLSHVWQTIAKIDGRNQILNAHRNFEYCRLEQTSRNEGNEISISDVQTDKRPRTFL